MPTKRVLHVLKYYRPDFTGEGTFLERLSSYMQALDPTVEHELLVTDTLYPHTVPAACSSLSRLHYLERRHNSVWRHELALVLWFVRNVRRFRTVHFHTHADWYFLTYFITRLCRRRLLLSATLDDSVPGIVSSYRNSLHWLAGRLIQVFHCYISISPKLQAETAAAMPHKECELIPNGITLPNLHPEARTELRDHLSIPADGLVLIFVGGLCLRKDPLFLIEQMPRILARRPDTWLVLVGPELEPDYVAAMRSAVAALALGDRVFFIGQVSDPDRWFQASDIMVFSSVNEGFGLVVPEAQTNGLPVVVRHLPGVNDLFVTHGETGFLFSDATGYREAVLRLAEDPALRHAIGERARAFVRTTLDMTGAAHRYLRVYGLATETSPGLPPSVSSDASIVEPRFRELASPFHDGPPVLLTVVDAEEAFDWSQPFSRLSSDVSSMQDQWRAHRIFDGYRVVPTYMVDYAVASQEAGWRPLSELLAGDLCDIGAQLHAWVTPPFEEELNTRNSFAGNLPLSLEYNKTRLLTEAIKTALHVRPRIFRSGRFGAGPRTGDILKSLDYLADSSVMPGWDFSPQGGPNYSDMPTAPFWIDADRSVLEIPSTSGFVGLWAHRSSALRRVQTSRWSERLFLPALTSRLGLLERIRLTPEGVTCQEAKRLVRELLQRGEKVFVLTYHSPSLKVGCTPYVQTQDDLIRFLNWLDEFYDFFTRELHGVMTTWREVRDGAKGIGATACSARAPQEVL
jgi:glycosyltransferase involved in cell wall biosynthesis